MLRALAGVVLALSCATTVLAQDTTDQAARKAQRQAERQAARQQQQQQAAKPAPTQPPAQQPVFQPTPKPNTTVFRPIPPQPQGQPAGDTRVRRRDQIQQQQGQQQGQPSGDARVRRRDHVQQQQQQSQGSVVGQQQGQPAGEARVRRRDRDQLQQGQGGVQQQQQPNAETRARKHDRQGEDQAGRGDRNRNDGSQGADRRHRSNQGEQTSSGDRSQGANGQAGDRRRRNDQGGQTSGDDRNKAANGQGGDRRRRGDQGDQTSRGDRNRGDNGQTGERRRRNDNSDQTSRGEKNRNDNGQAGERRRRGDQGDQTARGERNRNEGGQAGERRRRNEGAGSDRRNKRGEKGLPTKPGKPKPGQAERNRTPRAGDRRSSERRTEARRERQQRQVIRNGRKTTARRAPRYAYPPNVRYTVYRRGDSFPSSLLITSYFLDDWLDYQLSRPDRGYRWVRFGPDAVLINLANDRVVDVAYGVFDEGPAYVRSDSSDLPAIDDDISDDFLNGQLQLGSDDARDCEDFFGDEDFTADLNDAWDAEDWNDVARKVIDKNCESDISYYLLGLAAEGLELPDAAITYYTRALDLYDDGDRDQRCDAWYDDSCRDLDIGDRASDGLERIYGSQD